MSNEIMELKIYKELSRIYSGMFMRVFNDAQTAMSYQQDKPEEIIERLSHIANPGKWDYCGLLRDEDKAVLEMLEYLIRDDQTEIRKRGFWEPTKK